MRTLAILLLLAGCGGDGTTMVAAVCGDGVCNGDESHDSCCGDCGCINGLKCEGGQCVTPIKCGDGTCNGDETQASCCEDCGCARGKSCESGTCVSVCGDGICASDESASNCCDDCGCAAGKTCQSNSCVSVCGDGYCNGSETADNCCDDCACPTGESCKSGACEPNEVCGNHVCGVGEDTDNCCDDCGCNIGYSCQTKSCVYVGTSVMTWSIYDACNNGIEIDMRLFDVNAHLAWPGFTNYYVLLPNHAYSQAITCNTGNAICLGARQPGVAGHWGIDLDASDPTGLDACFYCAAGTATYNPSCP